jgi:hypothetical protein
MIAMAACDADCKFVFFNCRWTGSTNDAFAIRQCQGGRILMGTSLEEPDQGPQQLPPVYYSVGDDAFVNSNTLLTPWSGHQLNIWQDSFNYHLSAMRQCIERAFGIYIRRCNFMQFLLLFLYTIMFYFTRRADIS